MTWSDYQVEVDDVKQVHVTRLRVTGAVVEAISVADFEIPIRDQVPDVSDDPACGVQFQV